MLFLFLACTPLGLKNNCDTTQNCDTGSAETTDTEDTNANNPWDTNTDTDAETNNQDTTETDEDTAETLDSGDTAEADTSEPEEASCSWEIYERAKDYAAQYPERDGASWSGWCASLMWRFGELPESSARPSAILAYAESNIQGIDPRDAPIGAFHWWDIGTYGHVAVDVLGGGTTVFMASNYVLEDWGDAIGVTSIPHYTSSSGATYLGWSMDYVNSEIQNGGGSVCDQESVFTGAGTVPVSITEETGTPNTTFYMRMQLWASLYGYTGPIDGVLGSNSWAGFQRALADQGYSVNDTGTPDSATYSALQALAALHGGYTGPIDGVLGSNSYRGFAYFLNREL